MQWHAASFNQSHQMVFSVQTVYTDNAAEILELQLRENFKEMFHVKLKYKEA